MIKLTGNDQEIKFHEIEIGKIDQEIERALGASALGGDYFRLFSQT